MLVGMPAAFFGAPLASIGTNTAHLRMQGRPARHQADTRATRDRAIRTIPDARFHSVLPGALGSASLARHEAVEACLQTRPGLLVEGAQTQK